MSHHHDPDDGGGMAEDDHTSEDAESRAADFLVETLGEHPVATHFSHHEEQQQQHVPHSEPGSTDPPRKTEEDYGPPLACIPPPQQTPTNTTVPPQEPDYHHPQHQRQLEHHQHHSHHDLVAPAAAVMDAVLDVTETHPRGASMMHNVSPPSSLPEVDEGQEPSPKRQRIDDQLDHHRHPHPMTLPGTSLSNVHDVAPVTTMTTHTTTHTTAPPMNNQNQNQNHDHTFYQNKKQVHHEQWNEMLERLKIYKQKYGDCLVPKRFAEDPKLGTWVETQRVQFKRLPRVWDETTQQPRPQPNKRLTAERLQKLNDLGFCWSAKHIRRTGSAGSLNSQNSAPAATATNHNNLKNETFPIPATVQAVLSPPITPPVPTDTTDNGEGMMMMNMTMTMTMPNNTLDDPTALTQPTNNNVRRNHKSNHFTSEEQENALWEAYYQRLVDYQRLYGNCLVPRKYEADPKLGQWVEQQRFLWNRDYNKEKAPWNPEGGTTTAASMNNTKKLSLERKQKLDAIGFVWSLRSKRIEDHWDEMYRQLAQYKEEHGDCLVPSRYEQNLKLGKWVETQRYEYTKLQRAATHDTDEPVAVAVTMTTTHPNNNSSNSNSNSGNKAPPSNPRLTPERLRRLEAIGFEWKVKNKMKRYYDKQWDGMFQQLLDFKQKYGHVNVPKRYPENLKLGTWCHTQRIQYRKLLACKGNAGSKVNSGKTTPTQEVIAPPVTDGPEGASTEASSTMILEAPHPSVEESAGFTSYGTTDNEGSMDAQQQQVEDSYGDSAVARTIANWTAEQAQNFRLTEERRKRLEEVGFCWSAREGNEKVTLETSGRISRNSYDDQWDAMFAQLVKYKEEHGDCLVPKRYMANPKLGTWCDTQRVQYKKMIKKIAQMQHEKQNGGTNAASGDETGSVGSGTAAPASGTPLVGRLTQDRILRLQNLGFVWSLRDDWATHYEELKAYKAIHGNCNVPARYTANRRLGIWVSAQRQQYKILRSQRQRNEQPEVGDGMDTAAAKARRSAPLTQERIDLLNAIGFTWTIRSRDALGESWNQRLYELRQFKDRYGHCLVPSRFEENPELGIWVSTQRSQYRLYMRANEAGAPISTNMNEERIRELEEIGFVWNLRGPPSVLDEVAAAEAAVEIADQVAGGRHSHAQTQQHHRHHQYHKSADDSNTAAAATAACHPYHVHHPSNEGTNGDSSHEFIAAI